jgi:hypothetical protein
MRTLSECVGMSYGIIGGRGSSGGTSPNSASFDYEGGGPPPVGMTTAEAAVVLKATV